MEKKKLNLKKEHKELLIAVAAIVIIVVCFFLFKPADTSDTAEQPVPETETQEETLVEEAIEEDNHDHDHENEDGYSDDISEWWDDYETVLYGDTEIKRYDDHYMGPGNRNYQMAQYFWYNMDSYVEVSEDFNYTKCLLENRTLTIYRLDLRNGTPFFAYIEVEQDEVAEDASDIAEGSYYVKLTATVDGQEKEPAYFLVTLTLKTDADGEKKQYDISVEEVAFADIETEVESFSDEASPMTDNRTYAEHYLNVMKETVKKANPEQTELYWEGYDNPVDTETMMDILGYNE